MDYGYSFALDEQSSRSAEGLTVFNYLPVYDKRMRLEEKPEGLCEPHYFTPRYPVFLSISPYHLSFYEHYYNYERHEHIETVLLSIPLITEGENTLIASALQDAFEANIDFPFDDLFIIDEDRYSPFSRLSVFGTRKVRSDKTFIRKLFLDFLFDLFHSTVFRHSIFYEEMKISFQSDYYCNALRCKADYFFYKTRLQDLTFDSPEFKILSALFARAEDEWLKCIIDYRSDLFFPVFRESDGEPKPADRCWFQLPEVELSQVKIWKEKTRNQCTFFEMVCAFPEKIKRFSKDVKSSYNWYSKVYSITSTSFATRCVNSLWLIYLILGELFLVSFWSGWVGLPLTVDLCLLAALLCHRIDDSFLIKTRKLRTKFASVSSWCLQRYNLETIMGKNRWWGMFIVLMLFFVGMLISCRNSKYECWPTCIGIVIVSTLLIFFIIVKPVCFILGKQRDPRYLFSPPALLPRLAAAITTAWISLLFSNNLVTAFFDISLRENSLFRWICVLLFSVTTCIFLYFEISKRIPYEKIWVKFKRALMIFLIGFFYANLFGAFFVYLTGDRMIVRSGVLDKYGYTKICLKDSKPSSESENNTAKTVSMANDVPICFFDRPSEKPNNLEYDLERGAQYLDNISEDGKVYRTIFGKRILWNFMFFMSFLAMFIGIFLEMIFHEKPITTSK